MLVDVLARYGYLEVSAADVYSDIFKLGSGFIQASGEPSGQHKANPIILGSFKGSIRRRILYEDTFEETLSEFQGADWAITNGLTYWGRRNTGAAQSKMFAMAFDLDGQTDSKLSSFLYGATGAGGFQLYPMPQYVVLSGSNVHLYYVFEEPVDLYPNVKTQLKDVKYHLTDLIWNSHTSTIEKPQHQGINQGFRIVGGRTKAGGVVRAFRVNEHPCTVEELNDYVPGDKRVDVAKSWPETKCTIEEARKRWPAWYERVVVAGGDTKHAIWPVKRDLYDWWLGKCRTRGECGTIGDRYYTDVGVTVGHRYFCLMALAIFGVKCDVGAERVRADMESLVPFFDSMDKNNPFGADGEVDAAMECYDLRYVTFPRKDIERITAVSMPSNKRNGRKQSLHLKMARSNLAILNEDAGHALQGRKPKRDMVLAYAAEHPRANHTQVAKALGVSRPTVIKWMKTIGR